MSPRHSGDRVYYQPTDQGQEAKWKARLEQIKDWKHENRACMTFGILGTAVISTAKGAGTAPWNQKSGRSGADIYQDKNS